MILYMTVSESHKVARTYHACWTACCSIVFKHWIPRRYGIRTCAASTGVHNAAGHSVHNAAEDWRTNAAGFRLNNIA